MTRCSPVEMLFNLKLQTKLSQVFTVEEWDELKEIREHHDEKRLQQKKYFDMHKWAKPKNIAVSDKVLILFYLFKILKTIQSCTPCNRGAEVNRMYKIYLQKVSKNKRNLNKSTTSNIM